MQNPIYQIFDNLSSFKNALLLRKKAYVHALKIQNLRIDERGELITGLLESVRIISDLKKRIDDIVRNLSDLSLKKEGTLQCDFYYDLAVKSDNTKSIFLSLQLGDMWLLQRLEEYFKSLNNNQLQTFKEEIKAFINTMRESVSRSQKQKLLVA
ncbi:hypothetical protein [Jiulongibacter sediminis]|uniref:Uncharacterized protein n=1 Tax=Jiulongibacter sediminis TaxID=1605367 RepID=A0A0P7C4B8_9BACT|nr:hypothetical protein [Jiulongibacter sediminis]KPM46730.1 hypothetical protein AFM12_18335 [Jiulongibacter sediminis]TBX21636.1 hypothetical protein TK44_18340 [Jiulongibacter sediminis]